MISHMEIFMSGFVVLAFAGTVHTFVTGTEATLCCYSGDKNDILLLSWYRSTSLEGFTNGNKAIATWSSLAPGINTSRYSIDDNLCLRIQNVTEDDERAYECSVSLIGSQSANTSIHMLTIRITTTSTKEVTSAVSSTATKEVTTQASVVYSQFSTQQIFSKTVKYPTGRNAVIPASVTVLSVIFCVIIVLVIYTLRTQKCKKIDDENPKTEETSDEPCSKMLVPGNSAFVMCAPLAKTVPSPQKGGGPALHA